MTDQDPDAGRWTPTAPPTVSSGDGGTADPAPAEPWAPPTVDPGDAAFHPPAEMYAGGGTGQYAMNLGYAVDIVFVIDITGSMHPVLDQVKQGALQFHDRLLQVMQAKDKFVNQLRLRVVAYRDYYDNPSDALFHTPFLQLPADVGHFNAYVSGLTADGGGDEPESGLEALALAMASEWERGLDRRRHVIVVFTDASAHPLEAAAGRSVPGYPTGLATSFDHLSDLWDDPQQGMMEFAAKRLLLYGPDVYPWNMISTHWDNVLHYPSAAGRGLSEVQFDQIIDAIAGSV